MRGDESCCGCKIGDLRQAARAKTALAFLPLAQHQIAAFDGRQPTRSHLWSAIAARAEAGYVVPEFALFVRQFPAVRELLS
jgi:hypothetical protein